MNKDHDLDRIDKQILSILMKDANSTYAEIANQLEVSGGTIHVRMKKLEQIGVIKAMHLIADHTRLGYEIKAFVGVSFSEGAKYKEVVDAFKRIPEITNVNLTTGRFSAIVQLICKNNQHLKNILHGKIINIKGVANTETMISLDEGLSRQIDVVEIELNKDY
ncbi:MAG: winged helix-turn-helix transcriptional regulator [Saprospiraceae bacterium]|jgi:Lrp/AsnC family transcriptional regulator for asnA, asnC and gidA|nr:winged helix-turn-helix transcriptional regulator [Saprospiraceae bacterium]MCA0335146.1 winged helix-turn-helix transcriptional regulator [Bacteroidota bacterium]MCB0604856.1 winged helix-turn-helix transcriptional regulator [Saprospiraceae bacterium]MCO5278141.1 winged helix-turn-helix transcriptional regulator [Saprospiraceae bacterium]HMT77410.1 winged helix-turn-helix transcriptional regulator [Saprospiraceae bacterium]